METNTNVEIKNGKLLINKVELPLQDHVVLEVIGCGANAKVFSVYNRVLDRKEALKIWFPRKGQNAVDEDRFYAEVRKNAQFTGNDSIATIYSGRYQENYYYCLMEYCSGITLKKFLDQNPSWLHRWGLARQISDTVKSIYEKGLYHGDLHDKNILVDIENKDNWLKILDLGTSAFSGQENSHKRDAKMLYALSFELLPCIGDLPFYNDESIASLPSPLINQAFRAVVNISLPRTPVGQDPFQCPPDLYSAPAYSELPIWELASMLETTPLFSLNLVDRFLSDFGFGEKEQIELYEMLHEKISGDTTISREDIISTTSKEYEQKVAKYKSDNSHDLQERSINRLKCSVNYSP